MEITAMPGFRSFICGAVFSSGSPMTDKDTDIALDRFQHTNGTPDQLASG